MYNKPAIPVVLIIVIIIMISTITSILQVSNAAAVISINTAPPVDCNSKKGTTNTFAVSLNYGGVKCEGQNGGTAAAGGIKLNGSNENATKLNTAPPVDCNSKKGTTNTFAGSLNYGGVKCEGQNGGTAAAGGIKSDSGTVGIHGIQTPNDNSHLGGIIKR
jgi:hypothetical protein